MLEKIERIKAKPEAVRKRILYMSVFSIMAMVIGIWIYTLSYRFSSLKEEKSEQKSLSPFSSIGSFIKDAVKK